LKSEASRDLGFGDRLFRLRRDNQLELDLDTLVVPGGETLVLGTKRIRTINPRIC